MCIRDSSDCADVTWCGKLFRTREAATGKARSPYVDSVLRRTTRVSCLHVVSWKMVIMFVRLIHSGSCVFIVDSSAWQWHGSDQRQSDCLHCGTWFRRCYQVSKRPVERMNILQCGVVVWRVAAQWSLTLLFWFRPVPRPNFVAHEWYLPSVAYVLVKSIFYFISLLYCWNIFLCSSVVWRTKQVVLYHLFLVL